MLRRLGFIALLATTALVSHGQGQTDNVSRLSLSERIYVASKVYSTIQGYFNGWQDGQRADADQNGRAFDQSYRNYLQRITNSDDRRLFDLETMSLVALLHNGHTWFTDRWLQENYGQELGFYTKPVQGRWVVTRTDLPELKLGDEISAINQETVEEFFQAARKYLADSNERSEREDLFASGFLFPQQFSLTLSDRRSVNIVRQPRLDQSESRDTVEGRWLEPNSFAYIRIPSFNGVRIESAAIALVEKFKNAKGLIIDVRGNPGGYGNPPRALQSALIGRSFRSWRESSARLLSATGVSEVVSGSKTTTPEGGSTRPYGGVIAILVDHQCASFCEDFVMPFKDNHRATLVGETTAGTYSQTYFTNFDNGMMLNVAVSHEVFPNGDPFEGVGISPDIQVVPTVDDIRSHSDIVLSRALHLLESSHN